MSDIVLDASAVLALLRDELGGDTVAAHIGRAAISAVNLQEVVKEMLREGVTLEAARPVVDEIALALHPHVSNGTEAGPRIGGQKGPL